MPKTSHITLTISHDEILEALKDFAIKNGSTWPGADYTVTALELAGQEMHNADAA